MSRKLIAMTHPPAAHRAASSELLVTKVSCFLPRRTGRSAFAIPSWPICAPSIKKKRRPANKSWERCPFCDLQWLNCEWLRNFSHHLSDLSASVSFPSKYIYHHLPDLSCNIFPSHSIPHSTCFAYHFPKSPSTPPVAAKGGIPWLQPRVAPASAPRSAPSDAPAAAPRPWRCAAAPDVARAKGHRQRVLEGQHVTKKCGCWYHYWLLHIIDMTPSLCNQV